MFFPQIYTANSNKSIKQILLHVHTAKVLMYIYTTVIMKPNLNYFSPGIPVSSTNKTDCHDIAEILLKVSINTINHKSSKTLSDTYDTIENVQRENYMTTNCWYDMNIQEQTRQHNIDLEILHDVITLPKKLGLGRKFIL